VNLAGCNFGFAQFMPWFLRNSRPCFCGRLVTLYEYLQGVNSAKTQTKTRTWIRRPAFYSTAHVLYKSLFWFGLYKSLRNVYQCVRKCTS